MIQKFLILFSLTALLVAGLPVEAQTVVKRVSAKQTVAKGGVSDADVESSFRARMAKSKVGADNFQIKVQNGTATLTGKTNVVQHKGTATRMAKSSGATAVQNNIQVSDAAKQKAAANLAKGKKATIKTS